MGFNMDQENDLIRTIEQAAVAIKGKKILPLKLGSTLVNDCGFESLDIIDFFFEIQKISGIELDLTEISLKIGAQEGRRFNDVTFQAILEFLKSKK